MWVMPIMTRLLLVVVLMLATALLAQSGHALLALVPVVVAVFVMWGKRLFRRGHASR
jgi:hypothetical protein